MKKEKEAYKVSVSRERPSPVKAYKISVSRERLSPAVPGLLFRLPATVYASQRNLHSPPNPLAFPYFYICN